MALDLPQITVKGSPAQMGEAYGRACREQIKAFVADRTRAVETYFTERGYAQTSVLFEAGAACLERARQFDPRGHAEHLALSEAAGIEPVRLFTAANMTDIRDIITLPGDRLVAEDEGCTAALLPPSITENGQCLLGLTWDLNGPDVDYIIALHRLPDDGPETWAVTCTGCQTLMGMNEHGVSVGTTNLKTRGAKVGVPYLSVLHKALHQPTLAAASEVVEQAPVAGSHSYFVGDAEEAVEWEKTAQTARSRSTREGALARANHCLFDENTAKEADLSPSTHQRYARMRALLASSDRHSVESLKTMFADRHDGRMSINRFAEDASGATTNAVVAMNPADLEFWACRGQADRGVWTRLAFERTANG